MVEMQECDVATAAQAALVGRMRGIALYLEDLSILDIRQYAAILMTEIAATLLDLDTRSMDIS
jgi:hypothetical protein